MDAELFFHQRIDYDDGAIVEMVIWRVPSPVAPSIHDFSAGGREVGYDNERGKGDHRHVGQVEMAYKFSTVEQLKIDFWSDVHALRGDK